MKKKNELPVCIRTLTTSHIHVYRAFIAAFEISKQFFSSSSFQRKRMEFTFFLSLPFFFFLLFVRLCDKITTSIDRKERCQSTFKYGYSISKKVF